MASAKLDVDISGLQSGISIATSQLKTLNAQMKANEAEFKATGNSEKFMATQTAALNAKLQQQQSQIKNAEAALKAMKDAGIDPADKSFQDMQQTLLKAQTGMFQTQSAMNELGTSAQEAAAGADQLTESVNSIGKKISLEQVQNGISSITSGLENAAKKAVDLGKKLWDTIMDSARRADDTATMAQMYGIDLDTFMRMQRLVDSGMDTSIEAMLKGQSKLRDGLGDESKAVKEAFQELGIATKEYQKVAGESGQALVNKDNVQLFWEAGQALMAMSDAAKQESMAQTLFGRSWHELVPLFSEFKSLEEYNAALKEQEVNTEETIRDLAALNDAVSDLEASWTVLKDEILGAIAPALTAGANAVSGLLDKLTEYLKTDEGQEMLTKLGTAVSGLCDDLGEIDPEDVVSGFTEVFNTVVGSLQWLSDNWEGVVEALKGIVIGWGVLELTGGALQVLQLVQGISGLTGGAAAAEAAGKAAGTSWGGAFAAAVIKAAPWLVGLYTLLNPSGTAGDEDDSVKTKNGELTQGAFDFWHANPEQWLGRLGSVGDKFGDLASILGNAQAMQIIADPTISDEDVAKKLEEEIGLVPVEADIQVPEDTALNISDQVGEIELNGVVHITDVDGANIGVTGNWWGGDGTTVHKDRRPKHANGLSFVPYDGYLATLHRGEMVVPAREVQSRSYNSNLYVESMYMNSGADAEGLAAAMAAAQRRVMSGFGS